MTLALGGIAAFMAFAVGGMVGFASSLLFLPVLLLLDVPLPEAVVLNLALTVLTRAPTVVMLRGDLDRGRVGRMLAGTLPGVGAGVLLATVVPTVVLEVVAGAVVVISGIHLWRAGPGALRSPSPTAPLLVGVCSGVLGVTTSLNGVPPALHLARSGAPVRTRLADLSAYFVLGNCLTLAGIALTSGLGVLSVSVATATWLAAGVAGNLCGLWLAGFVDERRFDSLTVALVLLSGVTTLLKVGGSIG